MASAFKLLLKIENKRQNSSKFILRRLHQISSKFKNHQTHQNLKNEQIPNTPKKWVSENSWKKIQKTQKLIKVMNLTENIFKLNQNVKAFMTFMPLCKYVYVDFCSIWMNKQLQNSLENLTILIFTCHKTARSNSSKQWHENFWFIFVKCFLVKHDLCSCPAWAEFWCMFLFCLLPWCFLRSNVEHSSIPSLTFISVWLHLI